jgi:hypothetical protein
MENNGYLKFTGKYAELKHLGYKFQKLFAGNYMSWSKDRVFIFKKGSDVTHGNVNLFKLVKFLETKPVLRTSSNGISFYKFYSNTDENEYDYFSVTEENRKKYRDNSTEWGKWDEDSGDPAPEIMSMEHVSKKLLDLLQELSVRGWIETAYWDEK